MVLGSGHSVLSFSWHLSSVWLCLQLCHRFISLPNSLGWVGIISDDNYSCHCSFETKIFYSGFSVFPKVWWGRRIYAIKLIFLLLELLLFPNINNKIPNRNLNMDLNIVVWLLFFLLLLYLRFLFYFLKILVQLTCNINFQATT